MILLFLFPIATFATDNASSLPLATGTTWIYEARLTRDVDGKEQNRTLTWTTTITTMLVGDQLVVAKGTGFPSDLPFLENDAKPSPFLLVKVGLWRIYIIQNTEKIEEVWNKAVAGESLSDSITEGDLLLEFPLIEGRTYGETTQLLSGTPKFLYEVQGPASASSKDIAINFSTNADLTTWKYTDGIGFTGYSYRHHGSTSNVDCELKEFRPGT